MRPRKPILGTHLSIAGSVANAVTAASALDCNALQIFVKSPSQWVGKEIPAEDEADFRERVIHHGIISLAAHSSYLINLASPDDALRKRSITAFVDEIGHCGRLGIPEIVIHPGSHRDTGEKEGISRIIQSLDEIMEVAGDAVRICLETTSGQGSSIGGQFEHLRDIIAGLSGNPLLRTCIDTCHIFSAGYDISTPEGYDRTMEEFDSKVGFSRLSLFHLNDSLKPLGSKVDRHEHIGHGEIGHSAFQNLITDRRFEKIPMILETPKGRDGLGDRDNLEKLRSFHARKFQAS